MDSIVKLDAKTAQLDDIIFRFTTDMHNRHSQDITVESPSCTWRMDKAGFIYGYGAEIHDGNVFIKTDKFIVTMRAAYGKNAAHLISIRDNAPNTIQHTLGDCVAKK